ncbi:MAG: discoidin domain-containing protein [Hyphomicrobiales bacterium]|nr:discoidin domain-containing protein [Hyphomicrobiales bacterium]
MRVPPKSRWKATASSGAPRFAVDDRYATTWTSKGAKNAWLKIDLGKAATLAGLEVYWGKQAPVAYGFEFSADGKTWAHLCATRHGEGGQDVFAFPPVTARLVRWACGAPQPARGVEIVEINLYGPGDAASVIEKGRIAALGHSPVKVPVGESITVDFGYVRYPLGALIEWGETHGTVFSVHLSDNGRMFREVGRIATGDGDSDSFWWRSTTSRYFRLTVHEASAPDGAIVNELKLRILNKDRMPIGQLERAALARRGDLYPQSLLGRQVYWTALGEFDRPEEALFDEYGNLEPQRGAGQTTPMLRLGGTLHGAPGCTAISQSLVDGSLPIPSVVWSARDVELQATALAQAGEALVEYRIANRASRRKSGSLVLAVRPVQIDPYWQHGGHAAINAICVEGRQVSVNDRCYAALSQKPDFVTIADFDEGDVIRLIEKGPRRTVRKRRSDSALLSAAFEFAFSLAPGASATFVISSPMRDRIAPRADRDFGVVRETVARRWREKIGPRKITVGDEEVSDTVEAQTAFILVNATRFAFKPGPRNYDRTWIRDGSAQALALLWAGLIEEAKAYVLWCSKRIYENGMVPPILNVDGTVNTGYGGNIEFDAQGEFVGIAADVHRVSKDRVFLDAVFEPVVRATRFIEELCTRTNARYGTETRFHGLLAPSISHEGYSKPSYSYWDDYFALSAWRNCEYLALEIGDKRVAAHAKAKGREFAANLTRSIRRTAEHMGTDLIPGSADRDDVDPTSTSIAFEPCRVEDALPPELVAGTYDRAAARVKEISSPDFKANYSPYDLRNLNAFVSLGRYDDAFRLLSVMLASRRPRGWRGWAEVVWSDMRAPEYIGDMPHTWIGAEFATAIRRMLVRENGGVLELFPAVPDAWWAGEGIALRQLPTGFGLVSLKARRSRSQATVELALTGAAPDRITFRYPGAKLARADGHSCDIEADVISARNWSRLEIDI